MISETYRQLNEQLHKTNENYGTSGAKHAPQIHAIATALQTQDILDYGCGKSTLAQNLPFKIKQYDPAIAKYAALPQPADLVACTDVMEHIEPDRLGEVLEHLKSLVKKRGFFIIATRPAKKILADGRNAHLIIESTQWWLDLLWKHFNLVGFQDFRGEFLAIVEPK